MQYWKIQKLIKTHYFSDMLFLNHLECTFSQLLIFGSMSLVLGCFLGLKRKGYQQMIQHGVKDI